MIERVQGFVNANNLIEKNDHIVTGLSGGADSVCLFYVLLALKECYSLKITAVHVNHGLRGMAAEEDEQFVKDLCSVHNIPLEVFHEDVRGSAESEGLTEEEAGRMIRYNAFYKILRKEKANKIAVAHHMNDNAETILFHLFRGSGMRGLSGIAARRDEVIRPLLCIKRDEIESYLNAQGIPYQTDQTNYSTDYSRNKIRLNLLPYITDEMNKRSVDHIIEAGNMIREADIFIQKIAKDVFYRIVTVKNGKYSIRAADILAEDIVIQKYILRMVIDELAGNLKDIRGEHVNMLLLLVSKKVGKQINLPYDIIGVKTYDSIILSKGCDAPIQSEESNKQEIRIPGTYHISLLDSDISFQLLEVFDLEQKQELNKYKKNIIIPENRCTKWFDYDKIKNTVFIRTRHTGDYIQIDENGSRKKLKSYFIDKKIPRDLRDQIPLLADGDHIIWVIGERISEAYKVSNETRRILMVKLNGGNIDER